jgi:protease stability complex PrcB-like protein
MIDLVTIARGDASWISEPRQIVARDAEAWTALWAAHAGPEGAPPAIDFATRVVAAAFAGEQPSAGHAIEIVAAVAGHNEVRLIVETRAPAAGSVSAQIMTSPFHIVSLPRTVGEIRWSAPGVPRSDRANDRAGTARRTRRP